MKLLTFQAAHFAWRTHSKTLEEVEDQDCDERVEEGVVAFMHIEAEDEPPERRRRAFKHTLKHIKWIAGKKAMKRVVLHSFTHLGGTNAAPDFARAFMIELAERLRGTGYEVWITPFGYFCAWDIDVYGDSLAKVWKAI